MLVLFAAGSVMHSNAGELETVIDPWDYNYCGGKPVYPEIGFTFATQCGPRNQIALGRRGRLMWSFPSHQQAGTGQRGSRELTAEELKRLTLLAEVAQLADALTPQPGAINYQLGINFSGRPSKRFRGVQDARYSPANSLITAMLELVPVKPELPACGEVAGFFDPVQLPGNRQPLSLNELINNP